MIYSVWEQIDPLLFERYVSRLPFLSWRLIRDLRRDFLCTHAHTYQLSHSTQNSLCNASGFWQGNSVVMNVSFLLCVSMTLAGE